MAVDVRNLIAMNQDFLAKGRGYLEAARARGDLAEVAFQYSHLIQDLLQNALMKWRHRIESPTPELHELIRLAEAAAAELAGFDSKPPLWAAISFYVVPYAAILADVALRIPEICAPPMTAATIRGGYVMQGFDTYVTTTIRDGGLPPVWNELVEGARKKRAVAHFLKTYENYKLLLESALAGDAASVTDALVRGADLYASRANHPEIGGVCDGAGPANANMVDYRLAAIRVWSERHIGPLRGVPDDCNRRWWVAPQV